MSPTTTTRPVPTQTAATRTAATMRAATTQTARTRAASTRAATRAGTTRVAPVVAATAIALTLALPFSAEARRPFIMPSETVLTRPAWVAFDAAVSSDFFYFNGQAQPLDTLQ